MESVNIHINYKLTGQFLIGERDLCVPIDTPSAIEKFLRKLLQQPFSRKILFPEYQPGRIKLNKLSLSDNNEAKAEFILFAEGREEKGSKLKMYYMIEGSLSRTKTGLNPLELSDLERGYVWQIIESPFFKEYIYSEMGDRLPPDADKYCIKLKELSLEYGELLFSIQLL